MFQNLTVEMFLVIIAAVDEYSKVTVFLAATANYI